MKNKCLRILVIDNSMISYTLTLLWPAQGINDGCWHIASAILFNEPETDDAFLVPSAHRVWTIWIWSLFNAHNDFLLTMCRANLSKHSALTLMIDDVGTFRRPTAEANLKINNSSSMNRPMGHWSVLIPTSEKTFTFIRSFNTDRSKSRQNFNAWGLKRILESFLPYLERLGDTNRRGRKMPRNRFGRWNSSMMKITWKCATFD